METNSVDYICAVLRKLGMIEVRIEFSGSGDSGNICSLTWKGMCELEKTSVDTFPEVKWRDAAGAVRVTKFYPKPGMWAKDPETRTMDLWVERWFNAHYDNFINYDWVNNDGGGGTLILIPQENRVELDGYYNEMTSTPVETDYAAHGYEVVTDEVTNG